MLLSAAAAAAAVAAVAAVVVAAVAVVAAVVLVLILRAFVSVNISGGEEDEEEWSSHIFRRSCSGILYFSEIVERNEWTDLSTTEARTSFSPSILARGFEGFPDFFYKRLSELSGGRVKFF